MTRAVATGKVFNLAKLGDFPGMYSAGGVGATLGAGAGGTVMRNRNGVLIELTGTTEGLDIKLAAEGIRLTLAN